MHQGSVEITTSDRAGGLVATVTINRPASLNALSTPLMESLVAQLATLAINEQLRAVILTGAGEKAFIGGADIREMGALTDGHGARAFISRVHACCHAIRAVPVPVIARINGFTFGAGLEIAASCDLRIATDTARFGMPEVKLGIPSVVEAALLPMLVGWGRTRQMLLLGETFSAAEALAWGLLERCVPTDDLDEALDEWLAALMTSKPRAVRLQKQLIRAWEDLPPRAAVQAGIDTFAAAYDTDEPKHAMRDFFAEQARRKMGG